MLYILFALLQIKYAYDILLITTYDVCKYISIFGMYNRERQYGKFRVQVCDNSFRIYWEDIKVGNYQLRAQTGGKGRNFEAPVIFSGFSMHYLLDSTFDKMHKPHFFWNLYKCNFFKLSLCIWKERCDKTSGNFSLLL